jgi:hypothetical protein
MSKCKIDWTIERKTFSGKIGNMSFYFVAIRDHEKPSLWNLSIWQAVNDTVDINAVIDKYRISFVEINDICMEYIEKLKKGEKNG